MHGLVDFPELLVRLTYTENLSAVSSKETSSGLETLYESSERVVLIVCALMTLILCSLARTLVCSGGMSDLLLLCKTSLKTEIASALPHSGSSNNGKVNAYLAIYSTLLEYSSVVSESRTSFPWGIDRFVTRESR